MARVNTQDIMTDPTALFVMRLAVENELQAMANHFQNRPSTYNKSAEEKVSLILAALDAYRAPSVEEVRKYVESGGSAYRSNYGIDKIVRDTFFQLVDWNRFFELVTVLYLRAEIERIRDSLNLALEEAQTEVAQAAAEAAVGPEDFASEQI